MSRWTRMEVLAETEGEYKRQITWPNGIEGARVTLSLLYFSDKEESSFGVSGFSLSKASISGGLCVDLNQMTPPDTAWRDHMQTLWVNRPCESGWWAMCPYSEDNTMQLICGFFTQKYASCCVYKIIYISVHGVVMYKSLAISDEKGWSSKPHVIATFTKFQPQKS